MGGGPGTTDPKVVGPEELLWRFTEDIWYLPNASGKPEIQQAAFVGQVSLVRVALGITEEIVDAAKAGKFSKHGIAVLKASEIRSVTGGDLRVDPDGDWPPNAHVLFIRSTSGKTLRLKHREVADLTDLANSRPLLRPPKP